MPGIPLSRNVSVRDFVNESGDPENASPNMFALNVAGLRVPASGARASGSVGVPGVGGVVGALGTDGSIGDGSGRVGSNGRARSKGRDGSTGRPGPGGQKGSITTGRHSRASAGTSGVSARPEATVPRAITAAPAHRIRLIRLSVSRTVRTGSSRLPSLRSRTASARRAGRTRTSPTSAAETGSRRPW